MKPKINTLKEKLQYALELSKTFGGVNNAMKVVDELIKFAFEGSDKYDLNYVRQLLAGDTKGFLVNDECKYLLRILMKLED